MGLDATRKWKEEGFNRPWPEELVMDKAAEEKAEEMMRRYKLI
jgi:4-hydroxy-3-polyprenylbenzoate decarboxylase